LLDDILDWLRGTGAERARADEEASPVPQLPPAPEPKAVKAEPPAAPAFSLEAAIALMKKLPLDDEPELVLRVVRKTLRSIGISIEELVASAKQREDGLANGIAAEREMIEGLEREIAERKASIDAKLAEMKETHEVRSQLQDAMASESKVGPVLIAPPEIARLQAEALVPKPPAKAQPSPGTAPPKPSAAPPLKSKSPPRPPPVPPRKSTVPPAPKPPEAAKPAVPSVIPEDDDDAFTRPTARWEIDEPKKGD
jgi:hypothetical protein